MSVLSEKGLKNINYTLQKPDFVFPVLGKTLIFYTVSIFINNV